jgi:catechol 2,3-dioxygenase-like lactoylglutathione lyase family enzyme
LERIHGVPHIRPAAGDSVLAGAFSVYNGTRLRRDHTNIAVGFKNADRLRLRRANNEHRDDQDSNHGERVNVFYMKFGNFMLLLFMTLPIVRAAPKRPPIVGVSGFAVKTSSMDDARGFYSGVLGLEEAFTTKQPGGGSDLTAYKINDHQYVYISPELKGDEDRLLFVSFETSDARRLRSYLAGKGVDVPAAIAPDPEGNLSFLVKDPEENRVQFIQFKPGSLHSRNFGKFLSNRRTSDHALHVGYHVKDPVKLDGFYQEILGFRLLWKGGMKDDVVEWISMLVPDGTDWIEYMVNPGTPSVRQRGVWNHLCLGTLDMEQAHKTIVDRGYTSAKPAIGRDGRWLMHLYDKDLTRTEFMIRKPVEAPCCSPVHDVIK